MPIHMGIVCETCHKVHFIATSRVIKPCHSIAGMYRLRCILPCAASKEFRKETMRPYRVAEGVFRNGCANEGEYELIQLAKQPPPRR